MRFEIYLDKNVLKLYPSYSFSWASFLEHFWDSPATEGMRIPVISKMEYINFIRFGNAFLSALVKADFGDV